MKDEPADRASRPLPREWLPDPHPPEGAPVWDARTRRIMAAAGPEIQRLGSRRSAAGATGWSGIGLWWKPAAALAAAATTLLLLTGRPAEVSEPPPGSIPLSLVASEGDPVALWEALGIRAHPVLARIAIQEQGDVMGQGTPATTPEGENR